jgi:hypothetical protein
VEEEAEVSTAVTVCGVTAILILGAGVDEITIFFINSPMNTFAELSNTGAWQETNNMKKWVRACARNDRSHSISISNS